MKFSAILFDLDGTLVDTEKLWITAETEFLQQRGREFDPVRHAATHGTAALKSMEIIRTVYELDDEVQVIFNEVIRRVKTLMQLHSTAKPGAAELLRYIADRRIPCALVSNSSHEIIHTALENQRWADVLKVRCSADDVANPKPAPDLILYAAKKLGVHPHECLVIEDSVNGAKAAIAAGATCFAVPDGHWTPDFSAITPYVFNNLIEVLNVLEEGGL